MPGLRRLNTAGEYLLAGLLFGGASAWILWSVYFALVTISIPYPIEYREGAAQVMTEFLASRNNPFVLENQPLTMNNYGLGYNLVVMPFAILFGNTLLVHRSVTFVFILLCALASFVVIYKTKGNVAPAIACTAFILVSLMGRGGIGAFPPAMGTFLFLMTIFIPFRKGFTTISLVWSIIFSIAAFYTKAYFVLGFGIVASYLFLFVSRKTALFYGALFLVLFVISGIAVRLAFPLYFLNTIVSNISNTESSAEHLLSQLTQLSIEFFLLLLSSLFLLVSADNIHRTAGRLVNLRDWDRPLLGVSLDYFLYSFLCGLLAFVLFLGSHIGSYLNYAYQLVLPPFFCWFFLKFDPQKRMGFLIAAAVLFNLFFWGRNVLSPEMLASGDSSAWSRLYSHVRSSSNVLNSPVVTSGIIELGLTPLDSGQTSYFYVVKPYPNNVMFGSPYETLQADGRKYIRFIDNSIEKQKFDLVVTTIEKSTFYHTKLLEKFYVPVDQITINMPHTDQEWTVVIWKPLIQ